jgi:uncharacterized protein YcnI
MKFSAWSSLVISVCSALALASAASAHVSITPQRVVPKGDVEVVLSVPNEDDPVGVDHVTLGIPADFELDDAESKPGWTQSRTGQAITWSGGLIPKGQYARFALRGTAPAKAETILFNVLVGDRTGKSITYRIGLEVASTADDGADSDSLATAALVVALVAAALAVLALFGWLYRWLRPAAL